MMTHQRSQTAFRLVVGWRNLGAAEAGEEAFLFGAEEAFAHVPEDLAVRRFSKGGDTVVRQVKGWKMQSIYTAKPAAAVR